MERLLQEEVGAGDFNGNPPESRDQELFNRIAAEIDQDNNRMALDDDEDEDEDEEEEDDEGDEEEEEEAEEECSNGSPADEEAGELLTNGVGEENHSNNRQLNEEWHSGKDRTSQRLRRFGLFYSGCFKTLPNSSFYI